MKIIELELEGVKLIQPSVFYDQRGLFSEFYHNGNYKLNGIACDFVQDNLSVSKKNTLRGMHFQACPGQAKLVSVLCGEIFDVVVDIRPESPSFLKWLGVHLNADTREQLLIPVGFAHGFCVLSESAHVFYKVSCHYDAAQEKSFHYADPDVAIKWPVIDPILSEKDRSAPLLRTMT